MRAAHNPLASNVVAMRLSGRGTVQNVKDAKRLANESRASFTSWKLDIMDAMKLDRRMNGTEFRIAFCLIQHVNSVTKACFPSQELLADETGVKLRTVRASIAKLVRLRWARLTRPNRSKTNQYEFLTENVDAMLDRRTMLKDGRADARVERQLTAARKWQDRQKPAYPDGQTNAGKHLNERPESDRVSSGKHYKGYDEW
jgi:Helix-turn-helix domain